MQDNTIKTQEGIEVYQDKITMLCDEYISTLNHPEDIYNNKTFTGMIKYINVNYLQDLLHDKKNKYAYRYNNIEQLDSIFTIYVSLCYKYNNNPTLLEFSLLTGISREVFNNWLNGIDRSVSPEYLYSVKKWRQECELAQFKDKDIKSIFIMKSVYNYNDQLQQVPLEQQKKINADTLPRLGDDVM